MPASEANRIFNAFASDASLPLVIFHDHFIGRPGGVAVFFVDGSTSRDALLRQSHLDGWDVEYRPLVFSDGPSAFDEQIAFTLEQYRGIDWESLRREDRPAYGDHRREAETAEEDPD
jgi:hypothetical protein